ncbi:hypothetical protein Tco_1040804 [Tanacetum coccineum]|uniref:Uncharacterized protein n=1 Tax=Tanacetum coccineum TaxID=301880 RepID=A0ABQ5GEZ5_9ASTR
MIRKSAELMWKSFEIFSRSVLDFIIKSLMNLLLMRKLSHSSRNLATKEISDLLPRCLQTTCTNLGEPLLPSSTNVFRGKPQISCSRLTTPRFTKAIIQHFISKDKSISMRNKMFMHIVRDDSILGTLKFVAKSEDNQVYGALIPEVMINLKIQNSDSYKIYLAFATGKATPKKARKDTPGVSVSKKKAPAKAERNEGIVLLSEAALLVEAGGSGDGAGLEPEVPNEQKGKSIDTHEGIGLKPRVLDVSKADSSESEYESWGVSDDDDDDDKQGDDKITESDDDKNMYL